MGLLTALLILISILCDVEYVVPTRVIVLDVDILLAWVGSTLSIKSSRSAFTTVPCTGLGQMLDYCCSLATDILIFSVVLLCCRLMV